MRRQFETDNKRLITVLDAPALSSQRDIITDRLQSELIAEGGHLLELLPVHFIANPDDLAQLNSSVLALINLQTRLIEELIAELGKEGFLDKFYIPAAMRRFINWDELINPEHLVGRFDLLRYKDRFWCCEINTDSCVAGAEIFDIGRDFFSFLGLPLNVIPDRPLDDLAQMIVNKAHQLNVVRIVILDWSVGGGSAGKGYLSFERMRVALIQASHLPVYIADEKSYDLAFLTTDEARYTFVYRGFMMHEMDDNGVFLDCLLAAGTPVFSTYESEIRADKTWFSIFHRMLAEGRLSESESNLISNFVPYSEEVTVDTVDRLVTYRDDLIFKSKRSFGGAGILIGSETEKKTLRAAFAGEKKKQWIAQRMLPLETLTFPHEPGDRACRHQMVYGLYIYGQKTNGLLVRGSTSSNIVNVTIGHARLSWALELSTHDFEQFMATFEDKVT